MKSLLALLLLLPACWLEASAGDLPCPDETSQELLARVYELNAMHPLSRAEAGYADLIEQATTRPMDDLALRLACASLASRTFRTECPAFGYTCPKAGDDLIEWPARIKDWIPALKAKVPALKSCPDTYVGVDPKLPVVRAVPAPPRDVVDEQITGWVKLKLDVDEYGDVVDARVASSTSPRLEETALDAVSRFRYQPEPGESGFVPVENVSATVFIHYWDLARAAGCPIASRATQLY